jgi:hypothetical protein
MLRDLRKSGISDRNVNAPDEFVVTVFQYFHEEIAWS